MTDENKSETFHFDPDKNYDEETMEQQKEIEKDIALTQALIGDRVTLDDIGKEYAQEDTIYQHKIKSLTDKYVSVRRTRGDGNCFYRAFGFSYLEYLIRNNDRAEKFYELIKESKETLVSLGFPTFTIDDFHENFLSVIDEVKNGCTIENLVKIFNDPSLSDYLVVYLRLIVSGQLQKHHDFYGSFVDGDQSLEQFCHQEVEPMGKESDHIHVIALTTALSVPVQIAYMDRDEGSDVVFHNFPQEGGPPQVLLLYRPGHYDILYTQ